MASRRRWPKVVVALVFLVAVGTFEWLIWNPRVDIPAHADAILVPAYRADRQELARELAAQGISDNIVVSRSKRVQRLQDPNDRLTMADDEWFEECDKEYPHYRAFCIVPQPNSTLGEVTAFVKLAAEQGWESVLIVTERSHLGRVEMIMRRCFTGRVYGAASKPKGGFSRNVYRSFYELGAYVKDSVAGSCR